MKLNFGKHCNLMIWKWHSINLIPHLSAYNVASNDIIDPELGCRSWDGRVVGRAFQLTIFGIIIDFMYPNSKFKKQWFGKMHGPIWNKKLKFWYKDDL